MRNRKFLIVGMCVLLGIIAVGIGVFYAMKKEAKASDDEKLGMIMNTKSLNEDWEEVTEADANGMKLDRYTGDLYRESKAQTDAEVYEGLILSDGDQLTTMSDSYAWIDLDLSKEVKMDEVSQTVLNKVDRQMRICLEEGNLFFRVKELEEDESLDFVMSNATCSIKGTSGILETVSDTESHLLLLKGEVELAIPDGGILPVIAGDMVIVETVGDNSYQVTVRQIREEDIPAFVRAELKEEEKERIAEEMERIIDGESDEETEEPVTTLMDQYGDFKAVSVGNLVDQGDYYSGTANIYDVLPTSTDWPGELVGAEEVKIAKDAVVHWFISGEAPDYTWTPQDISLDEYVHMYGRDYSTASLRMMGKSGWADGNDPIEYNEKGYIIGFYDAPVS